MKILYIIDSLRSGGKERQLVELLKGITLKRDIKIYLVLLSHDVHYKDLFQLNMKVYYVKRKYKKDLKPFIILYKIFRHVKPDIVHSWGSMPSIYSLPAVKILGIKFINGMIRSAKARKKLGKVNIRSMITFPFSDVVVSNTKAGLKAYKKKIKKSICIYNGFDPMRLDRIEEKDIVKKKYNINRKYVVGMVATFSDFKDYETYILAAKNIIVKRDDIIFLAIGDGKNLNICKKKVNKKYKDQFIFLGRKDKIESIVNIFNVGVLLTNTKLHEEGISNSILEYMALGKPIISTRCGGNEETVKNGINGFIIPPFDQKKLVEKIEYLIDNKTKAKKMGKNGKKRVEKYFSQKK